MMKASELTKLADAAFNQAAKTASERAEKHVTPVIIWENGAISRVDPKKFKKKHP
jgi:hypothetical protein